MTGPGIGWEEIGLAQGETSEHPEFPGRSSQIRH